MVTRGTLAKVVAGLVVLSAVGAGGLYALYGDFQQPRIQSVENEFGSVDRSTTEIRTQVVVQNPNDKSLPGGASLRYTVEMNSVTMATGSDSIDLRPGRNVLNLTTSLDNGKVPAWWVTHVRNNETTVMRTKPSVSFGGLPFGASLPAQEQVIRTDLLGSFSGEANRTVSLGNASVLRVSGQEASWGTVRDGRTPIVVSTDLENVHDRPVQLDGTAYRIEMNGVVVGNGTTNDSISLQPGESGTFTARPAIDADRMQAWWVSHLRQNQSTRLSVEVYGLVEKNGTLRRVPVTIYRQRAALTTDFLGDGNATIEQLETPRADDGYRQPELVAAESEWGTAGDSATEIRSELVVSNPNDGDVGDLVTLRVDQGTSINGVEVAEGQGRLDGLEPGNNTLALVSEMPHDTVPRWWARHLNRGEESTVTTSSSAVADVGVTTLSVPVEDRRSSLTTDLLDGFNDTSDESVQQDGRTVIVVRETSAAWGEATPERAPVDVAATLENRQPRSVTIRDITYTVELNGVSLADNRTADGSWTLGPYERRTIRPRLVLDNTKMAAWWPTHVRNGERSQMTTTIYATVESPAGTKTVELDSLSQNRTVTTNVLG